MPDRGRYYEPAREIRLVPNLKRRPSRHWPIAKDEYSGSADAIVASGLVPLALLPGQPGAPVSSACYRPNVRLRSETWHIEPGYMQILRTVSGSFRVILTVSLAERARRQNAENDRRQKADAAAEDVLGRLPQVLRDLGAEAVKVYGSASSAQRAFLNLDKQRAFGIEPHISKRLARCMDVFMEAEEARRIEYVLVGSSMPEAKAMLARLSLS